MRKKKNNIKKIRNRIYTGRNQYKKETNYISKEPFLTYIENVDPVLYSHTIDVLKEQNIILENKRHRGKDNNLGYFFSSKKKSLITSLDKKNDSDDNNDVPFPFPQHVKGSYSQTIRKKRKK